MSENHSVSLDGQWYFQVNPQNTDAIPEGDGALFLSSVHAGGTLILSAYGQWRGPGHNGILIEDGVYWMVYHAYDAKQIGIPKLRIESISWDTEGWPSLPSQSK